MIGQTITTVISPVSPESLVGNARAVMLVVPQETDAEKGMGNAYD